MKRIRFTIAGVASLAVASIPLGALSACSDDGPAYDPAYPVEGGPTERPTKDVNRPEIIQPPDPPPAEAGTCDPLGTSVDVRFVAQDPNNELIGGAILDGTYKLTDAVFATAGGDGGVAFKRAAYMKIEGKNITWDFDTDDIGKPKPTCCVGTWAFDDTTLMQMNMICNGKAEPLAEFYDFHPKGIPDAGTPDGGEAGAPQIMIHIGELHDIYTRQ